MVANLKKMDCSSLFSLLTWTEARVVRRTQAVIIDGRS